MKADIKLLAWTLLLLAGVFSACQPVPTNTEVPADTSVNQTRAVSGPPPARDEVVPGWIDLLTIKYDATGQEAWKKLNAVIGEVNKPTALHLDDFGGVYVSYLTSSVNYTARSYLGGYRTDKYHNNGSQLWTASVLTEVPTPGGMVTTVDAEGNLFLAGSVPSMDGKNDLIVYKYDTNGRQVWHTSYRHPERTYEEAADIAVDRDGSVYLAAQYYAFDVDNYDYLTMKFDNQGNLLWVVTWDGPAHSKDVAKKLAVDSKGNVYVTGESLQKAPGQDFDWVTVKYDKSGKELWTTRYTGAGNNYDTPSDMRVDLKGNVYITGRSWGAEGAWDWRYATIKYDTNGRQIWANYYVTPGSAGLSYGSMSSALEMDENQNIFVVGESWSDYRHSVYATLKYSKSGQELWVRTYGGAEPGVHRASALSVDDEGSVYVTGLSKQSSSVDTVKYDSGGWQLWVASHSVQYAFDTPVDLKVDKQKNVFVVVPIRHW